MKKHQPPEPALTLAGAVELAKSRHQNKPDKDGRGPYYLHALRVMVVVGMPELGPDSETRQMTGVLHDIVEHGNVTISQLLTMGAPGEVVEAVDALTEKPGQSAEDFISAVKQNPLAKPIKVVDNRDNKRGKTAGSDSEDERRALEQKYDHELELLIAGDERLASLIPIIEERLEAIYREEQGAVYPA